MQLKMSGLYWCSFSKRDAERTLKDSSFGDFLIRDSKTHSCLLTISIKCKTKVVHMRTVYSKGQFSIEEEFYGHEPKFESFLSMIEYYVTLSRSGTVMTLSSAKNRKYSVQLLRALKTGCPSLKHLCRTKINSLIEERKEFLRTEKIPSDVESYLADYPFSI